MGIPRDKIPSENNPKLNRFVLVPQFEREAEGKIIEVHLLWKCTTLFTRLSWQTRP